MKLCPMLPKSFSFRIALTLFTIAVYLSGPSCQSIGSWEPIGPTGGNVECLLMIPGEPSTVFAGTNGGGIWVTRDGGDSWTSSNSGVGDIYINTLERSPDGTLYAGTYNNGPVKSTDSGKTWTKLPVVQNRIEITDIRSIAVNPKTPSTVYISTEGGHILAGIHRSEDGGKNWKRVITGLPQNLRIYSLAIDPISPSTLYAGVFTEGVFKSTDSGETWVKSNSGITDSQITSLLVDPDNSHIVYVATNLEGVFKSTDGGASWSQMTNGLKRKKVKDLAFDPANSQILYAATSGRIYRSNNGAIAWTGLDNGLPWGLYKTVAVSPATSSTVFTGNSTDGIFKSTDRGETWTDAMNGMKTLKIEALIVDPGNPEIIYAGSSNNGVYITSDGGNSWTHPDMDESRISSLAMKPGSPEILFAGTAEGMYKSTNSGTSWMEINNGIRDISRKIVTIAIHEKAPDTMIIGRRSLGVITSTDGGASWMETTEGLTERTIRSLAFDSGNPQIAIAGTINGIFRSHDSGATWKECGTGLPALKNFDVIFAIPGAPGNFLAGTSQYGMYKTTDHGDTWRKVTYDGRSIYAITADPDNPATLYAGVYGGVYSSKDAGNTWTAVPGTGLTNVRVQTVCVTRGTPKQLLAGTGGGSVFRLNLK